LGIYSASNKEENTLDYGSAPCADSRGDSSIAIGMDARIPSAKKATPVFLGGKGLHTTRRPTSLGKGKNGGRPMQTEVPFSHRKGKNTNLEVLRGKDTTAKKQRSQKTSPEKRGVHTLHVGGKKKIGPHGKEGPSSPRRTTLGRNPIPWGRRVNAERFVPRGGENGQFRLTLPAKGTSRHHFKTP